MKLNNKFATELTSRDKNLAIAAAKHIIDEADLEAWMCFVESSDSIFDFIKKNIASYFSQVVNENNYKNIFKLFKIHSFDWDECLIQIMLKFSYENDELTTTMLNLLENGNEDEKTYAAKFFSLVPNERANYYLFQAYSVNYEPLKYNAARALGDCGDEYSYNYYMNKLNSEDPWEKTDAAQFLQWYGNKKAFQALLKAMNTSSMPEHIAGNAAMLDNISTYFDDNQEFTLRDLSLDCYQQIIDSLAEIWPLAYIFDFELYSCVEKLISLVSERNETSISSRYCSLLLKTKYQLSTFMENDEYKFNEDKNTLEMLENILELLYEGDEMFWQSCIDKAKKELFCDIENRVVFFLETAKLMKLSTIADDLKTMLLSDKLSESLTYHAVVTLKSIGTLDGLNLDSILSKIKDENLNAVLNTVVYQA